MFTKIAFGIDLLLAGIGLMLAAGCARAGHSENIAAADDARFKSYWYQGVAELSHYRLEQARYGEVHHGDAVLIFVTEDFLPGKQVKYESGDRPAGTQSVLKLNFTRKFNTGIYPYSMMTSIFSPVALSGASQPLKLAASAQEWCGQTYMQLNRRSGRFRGELHSYFQSEADQELDLPAGWLEDQIWTQIRLNPAALPQGEIHVIPGGHFLRFRHEEIKARKALGSLTKTLVPSLSADSVQVYRLEYPEIPRTLEITFSAHFPYEILAWEEENLSGFASPKMLKTRAVRTHSLLLDYWNKHSLADSTYRGMLGM